jgi:hypothetical protein
MGQFTGSERRPSTVSEIALSTAAIGRSLFDEAKPGLVARKAAIKHLEDGILDFANPIQISQAGVETRRERARILSGCFSRSLCPSALWRSVTSRGLRRRRGFGQQPAELRLHPVEDWPRGG